MSDPPKIFLPLILTQSPASGKEIFSIFSELLNVSLVKKYFDKFFRLNWYSGEKFFGKEDV